MITIQVRVVTIVDYEIIYTVDGEPVSFEETLRMPITRSRLPLRPPSSPVKTDDRYQALNPQGPMQARIALDGKIGGPPNTYSSIGVTVDVSARCNQSEEAIEQAKALLFQEGLKTLDRYVDPTYEWLVTYLKKRG